MGNLYIYKTDKVTGKTYKILYKTKERMDRERLEVSSWLIKNIEIAKPNEYCLSLDVYEKFIKDTCLKISHKSFGAYLNKYLNSIKVSYVSVSKNMGSNTNQLMHCYFGFSLQDGLKYTQYFDLIYYKRQKANKKREKHIVHFGYFNEKNFNTWVLNRLEKQTGHLITTQELFLDYCKFFSIENMQLTRGNFTNFGDFFCCHIKKSFLNTCVKGMQNKKGLLKNGYANIKLKDQKI